MCFELTCGWGKVGVPRVGPRRVGPRRVGAQNFAFFFPCPAAKFVLFFPLWGGLLVEFWWCLKHRGAQMCTLGVLGLSCASPGGPVWWGRRGSHTTAREPRRAHLRVPVFKNTTKIQREDIQRGKKRTNFAAGEEKKERNFGRSRGGPGKGGPGKGGPGKGGPGGTEHDQTKTMKPPHGNRETKTHKQQHTQTHTNTHKHTKTHKKHKKTSRSRFGQTR